MQEKAVKIVYYDLIPEKASGFCGAAPGLKINSRGRNPDKRFRVRNVFRGRALCCLDKWYRKEKF
jgi:hypothetical protein